MKTDSARHPHYSTVTLEDGLWADVAQWRERALTAEAEVERLREGLLTLRRMFDRDHADE